LREGFCKGKGGATSKQFQRKGYAPRDDTPPSFRKAFGSVVISIMQLRLLPFALVFAFLARIGFAFASEAIVHPDAIFQYLEQGHRLAFGYGVIPWEYSYGVRSWLIPGFIALLFDGLKILGADKPALYQPIMDAVFCTISLSLPFSVYRIAQGQLDEATARVALVLTAFWYELIYFASAPLADALATYALFGALRYLLGQRPSAVGFGLLAGLTIALRYQFGPAVLVAFGIAIYKWRRAAWPAIIACLIPIGMLGVLDAYSWGMPFASIIVNLEMNFVANVASQFSSDPLYFYLAALARTSLGIAYVGILGLALTRRQTWPIAAIGITILLTFTAVAHKEDRFIFPVIPAYLIGLAAVLVRVRATIAAQIAILAATASVIGIVLRADRDDLHRAYRLLSERSDVEGVIDDSGVPWYLSGGYYDLHQPVPIYRTDMPATNIGGVRAEPGRFASHWITSANRDTPAGFSLLARFGNLAIWQRSNTTSTMVPPGYQAKAPFPVASFNLDAVPIKVTPRW
jgi:GPI mannosyltransferase 3